MRGEGGNDHGDGRRGCISTRKAGAIAPAFDDLYSVACLCRSRLQTANRKPYACASGSGEPSYKGGHNGRSLFPRLFLALGFLVNLVLGFLNILDLPNLLVFVEFGWGGGGFGRFCAFDRLGNGQ